MPRELWIDGNLAALAHKAGWLDKRSEGHYTLTKTGRHLVLQAKREGVYEPPTKVLVTDD